MGLSKFEAIAAKCIGLDDLGPCPDIGFVDAWITSAWLRFHNSGSSPGISPAL